jgi:hypothetical protein
VKAVWQAVLWLAFFVAACAAPKTDLEESGVLRVVRLSSSTMTWVKGAKAFQEGQDVVVAGTLFREGPFPVIGEVDAILRDLAGAVIAQARTVSVPATARGGPKEATSGFVSRESPRPKAQC